MTTVEILRKAKELLTPDTWGQGDSPPHGRICAAVAVGRAVGSGREGCAFSLALGSPFDKAIRHLQLTLTPMSVSEWNDTAGRTLSEIYDGFDRAIAVAEATP